MMLTYGDRHCQKAGHQGKIRHMPHIPQVAMKSHNFPRDAASRFNAEVNALAKAFTYGATDWLATRLTIEKTGASVAPQHLMFVIFRCK